MNQQLGAHELLDLKEVLDRVKSGINVFKLYKPLIQDHELQRMVDHQLRFMIHEYNTFVNNLGVITEEPALYEEQNNVFPNYGVNPTTPVSPSGTITDRDIAANILGFHKSTAAIKLQATLECADEELRSIMLQSSNNCVHKAYEVWVYMNKKGYYQVPVLDDDFSHQIINQYEPINQRKLESKYM